MTGERQRPTRLRHEHDPLSKGTRPPEADTDPFGIGQHASVHRLDIRQSDRCFTPEIRDYQMVAVENDSLQRAEPPPHPYRDETPRYEKSQLQLWRRLGS